MSAMSRVAPGIDTEEQAALRDSVRGLLAAQSDVRRGYAGNPRYDVGLWESLTQQIGVAALAIPEEFGGIGATLVETHVVLEELGAGLSPVPMLGSAVLAAQAILRSGDDAACERLLPGIAEGTTIAALCWAGERGWAQPGVRAESGLLSGTAHYVLDAEYADVLIVLAESGGVTTLHSVAAGTDGVTIEPHTVLDPTRALATVRFDEVDAEAILAPADLVDQLRTVAAIALSADQVGAARAALDLTVEYTKSRTQFGRVIGSFQALKHRMADLFVLNESSTSISYTAVDALVRESDEAPALAAAAKVYCTDALRQVTSETIQLHGGIGITWEHDAHLYFKRAHSDSVLFGSEPEALAELEIVAGLAD